MLHPHECVCGAVCLYCDMTTYPLMPWVGPAGAHRTVAPAGSTTATNPVAGAGAGTGTAGSWPGDAAAAEHEATSTSVAGALAEDRCVLAAHLAPLTPEAILQV